MSKTGDNGIVRVEGPKGFLALLMLVFLVGVAVAVFGLVTEHPAMAQMVVTVQKTVEQVVFSEEDDEYAFDIAGVETAAHEYASWMWGSDVDVLDVWIAGPDTDQDGYVTVLIATKGGDERPETQYLECGVPGTPWKRSPEQMAGGPMGCRAPRGLLKW